MLFVMCIYTDMNRKQTSTPSIDDMDVTMCTCANLRRTTRVVTQYFDGALKPAGLTPGQFTVLSVLSRQGPQRQTQLADTLAMDRTTLIRNVRPLEKKGLVATGTAGNRGAKTLTLTTVGARALEDALPHWQQAQARIIEALGTEGWGGLIAGLSSAVQAVKTY